MNRIVLVLLALMVTLVLSCCSRPEAPAKPEPAAPAPEEAPEGASAQRGADGSVRKTGEMPPPLVPLERYDGRPKAPCPPEVIAYLMDRLIGGGDGVVSIGLLPHAEAGRAYARERCVWVLMRNGKPVSFVPGPRDDAKHETSGMTARALKRAREFIAEHFERSGLGTEYHLELAKLTGPDASGNRRPVTQEERFRLMRKYQEARGDTPKDWKVNEAYTTWEHQAKVYGVQITEMTLTDKNTESWKVTAKPIAACDGGEIWMRFDKHHMVSAELGK